jgi:hypothetical protein
MKWLKSEHKRTGLVFTRIVTQRLLHFNPCLVSHKDSVLIWPWDCGLRRWNGQPGVIVCLQQNNSDFGVTWSSRGDSLPHLI